MSDATRAIIDAWKGIAKARMHRVRALEDVLIEVWEVCDIPEELESRVYATLTGTTSNVVLTGSPKPLNPSEASGSVAKPAPLVNE